MRSGEWYLTDFGWHGSYEEWHASRRLSHVDSPFKIGEYILSNHEPLPLSEEMETELDKIFSRAKES